MCWQFSIRQLRTENPLGLLGREYPRDTFVGEEKGEQTSPLRIKGISYLAFFFFLLLSAINSSSTVPILA